MSPLVILKLWMLGAAIFVAPFHRFAAIYVGCYVLALMANDLGLSEPVINIGWHGLAAIIGAAFPTFRRGICGVAYYLFGPLLFIDTFRLFGWTNEYYAWWAVWAIVMAQVALLFLSVDGHARRAAIQRFQDSQGGAFFRTGAA